MIVDQKTLTVPAFFGIQKNRFGAKRAGTGFTAFHLVAA